MKVKVKVFKAGSLIVEGVDAKEIFDAINFHLGINLAREVAIVRRGAPKKVKKDSVTSEGAAGVAEQG